MGRRQNKTVTPAIRVPQCLTEMPSDGPNPIFYCYYYYYYFFLLFLLLLLFFFSAACSFCVIVSSWINLQCHMKVPEL